MLGKKGMYVVHIKLMVRWTSPLILRYTKMAPLQNITKDYSRLKVSEELQEKLDEIQAGLRKLDLERGEERGLKAIDELAGKAFLLPQDGVGSLRNASPSSAMTS